MPEDSALVYIVTNLVSGNRYVGVTVRKLAARWADHVYTANAGKSWPLQRAIRKYGAENFSHAVLARYPTIEWAKAAEVYYIAQLAPEYNATNGGDGVWGFKHTDESKAKMAAQKKGKKHGRAPARWITEKMIAARIASGTSGMKGRTHSDEAKRKIGAAGTGRPSPQKGKPASPESIAKRVATYNERDSWPRAMLGKKMSEESIAKRTATRALNPPRPWLGKKMTDEQRYKVSLGHSRPLECVTDGRKFARTRDAAAFYGCHMSTINGACNGRLKTAKGRVFRWIEK